MNSVLTVDASASMRKLVSTMLNNAGFEVTAANDGLQALDIAKETHFDLILTDVNMPNMGGLDLCKKLRMIKNYELTPILMLSNDATHKNKSEANSVGATGWVGKPLNADQLLQTIAHVL